MSRNKETSAVVDGILRFVAAGGIMAAGFVAPNIIQALDKPLRNYFDKLDARSKSREYKRYIALMKRQRLIAYSPDDYEHGINLTRKGAKRAERLEIEVLAINVPKKWDQKWRIILFDIPESNKTSRDYLSCRLKSLGFVHLQKSVLIHPFECREIIEKVVHFYDVSKYVTYIETSYIDSQDKLKNRFKFKF